MKIPIMSKTSFSTLSATLILLVSAAPFGAWADVKPGVINLSQKTVNDQIQIVGSYGSGWTEAGAKKEASDSCRAIGQTLATFTLGEFTSRNGQTFLGICK